MKINNAIHALNLLDQKNLISKRTILTSKSGVKFKFYRVDTQLNWLRVIVEDELGKEIVLNSKDVFLNSFIASEPEIRVEAFILPA